VRLVFHIDIYGSHGSVPSVLESKMGTKLRRFDLPWYRSCWLDDYTPNTGEQPASYGSMVAVEDNLLHVAI
jgi:hypothetical protein